MEFEVEKLTESEEEELLNNEATIHELESRMSGMTDVERSMMNLVKFKDGSEKYVKKMDLIEIVLKQNGYI